MYSFYKLLTKMSTFYKSIDLLEKKLQLLIERYVFLKEENDLLLKNINDLQIENKIYISKLEKEQEKCKLLKITKTIEGSTDYSKETKNKINALVREIDKCIVKLNQ
jgi:hypothetical protein